jgi:hypothetical protein
MCVFHPNYAKILERIKKSFFFKCLSCILQVVRKERMKGFETGYAGARMSRFGVLRHKAHVFLTACLLVTLCSMTLSSDAKATASGGSNLLSAQEFFSNPQSLLNNPGGIGQNAINLVQQGVDPSQVAQVLSSTGISTPSELTPILQNLSRGTIDLNAATQVLNGLATGVIDSAIASALSQVPNLGNLNVSSLTSLLNNPSISQALNSLSAGQLTQAIDQIAAAAIPGGLNGLTSAAASTLANNLASQFPQVAQAFGGAAGLNAALQGLAGGAGGSLSGILGGIGAGGIGGVGSGGAFNNPVGIYHSDAGPGTCGCQRHRTSIPQDHNGIRLSIKTEFEKYREWLVADFWLDKLLPSLMLMAEQLSVVGMHQVQIIGTFLDAKHQLETQRVIQQMTAQAHKDYHPSEGMCTFGTTVQSLAPSQRKSELAQITFASRMMQRQTMSGDTLGKEGENSDIRSRLVNFIAKYCNKADNGNGLTELCQSSTAEPARQNIDIDFTRNIETKLTLEADFTPNSALSKNEEDIFALSANLYSHNIAPRIAPELLAGRAANGGEPRVRLGAAERYLDLRSVYAKRSVAQNSFAAIVGMRAEGTPESAPYTKALMRELGVSDPADIDKLLGKNPSYFAQMEVLTKKLYQNPAFYTELYDKPVNVDRKGAAIQAISLMQDRDIYNSLLRSEAVLSVLLETMLIKEQQAVSNAISGLASGEGQ